MSTIDQELLALADRADSALDLPRIEKVVLPDKMLSVSEAQAKHDKFGVVVLANGHAGFFYRLLGVNPGEIQLYRETAASLQNRTVLEAAQLIESRDAFHRALALGAINAATQALFASSNFVLPAKQARSKSSKTIATASPSTEVIDDSASQAVIGMVGYFRQQVSTLLSQGHRVVVLELNPEFHTTGHNLLISGDITSLDSCDRIYCTASTLINNTLEGLLAHFSALPSLPHIEIVGPSAGCFPDALFSRGASVIGGSVIIDINRTCERIQHGEPWLDAASKFSLSKSTYPGFDALIAKAGTG